MTLHSIIYPLYDYYSSGNALNLPYCPRSGIGRMHRLHIAVLSQMIDHVGIGRIGRQMKRVVVGVEISFRLAALYMEVDIQNLDALRLKIDSNLTLQKVKIMLL